MIEPLYLKATSPFLPHTALDRSTIHPASSALSASSADGYTRVARYSYGAGRVPIIIKLSELDNIFRRSPPFSPQ